jgi:hypothetical protein
LNSGKDLPEEFLLDLYSRVTTDEMKMLKEGEDKLSRECLKRGWLQMKTTFWVRRYWFILIPDRLVWFKNVGVRRIRSDQIDVPPLFSNSIFLRTLNRRRPALFPSTLSSR